MYLLDPNYLFQTYYRCLAQRLYQCMYMWSNFTFRGYFVAQMYILNLLLFY